MQVLKHRKLDNGSYDLVIHVDEDAVLNEDHPLIGNGFEAGDPHPESVREFSWPAIPPKLDEEGNPTDKPAMTQKEYEEMMLREAKLLIEHELAQQQTTGNEGVALENEGKQL